MRHFSVSWFFIALISTVLSHGAVAETCRTKYPIVLAHGVFASASFISLKKVADVLNSHGCPAYLTEVSSANSIAMRGTELRSGIDRVLSSTKSDKVNLIAHSMGGLDARYLISTLGYGKKVASLTTISTPHRGTSDADHMLEDTSAGAFRLFNWFAALISSSTTVSDADLAAALSDMSVNYVTKEFNPANPDDANVYYQSFAASGSPNSKKSDRIRPILRSSYQYIVTREGANDGLVPVSSAKWGNFMGILPADHLSTIGALLPSGKPPFDYAGFFLGVASGIKSRGF